ncbi:MAG: ATP-binding cassette subfamily F protein uup, partial [Verrucomicrobiales bacterium]
QQEVKAVAPRKLKWKEERELEDMEGTIGKLETRIAKIESNFADPEFYKDKVEELPALEKQLKDLKTENEQLYKRWEELESIKAESDKA